MSFDRRLGSRGRASDDAAGVKVGAPGKQTLTGMLPAHHDVAGASPGPGASLRADLPSPGGRRRLGFIANGRFIRAPGAQHKGSGVAGQLRERAFVGTAGSRKADVARSDGVTTVELEDETDNQIDIIVRAVTSTRAILDQALARIGNPADPKVKTALEDHFRSSEPRVATEVRSRLHRIRNAFNGTIPIEVEASNDYDARAYVPILGGDIHLGPDWFNDYTDTGRERTLIHECSHKYADTDDNAYISDPAYGHLSVDDALENADSYGNFCVDVL